jgi:hypothetical protein
MITYVRDQLLAAHESWRLAGCPDSPKVGGWLKDVKPDDALAMFQFIDEHIQLATAQGRSNWRSVFRDSVQLRRMLTKHLESEHAQVVLAQLAEQGLPEFAITWSNGAIQVRNLGPATAHDVEFIVRDVVCSNLAAVHPGYQGQLGVALQGSPTLMVRWRDSRGRRIEEGFRVQVENKMSLAWRRLLNLQAFALLGPTDPAPE